MNISPLALHQTEDDLRLGKSSDPRALRTRKALQEALVGLLTQAPFDQIKPQQIASQAGVARASFYLHYPSKEALLADVAHGAIRQFFERGMIALDRGGAKAAALSNCQCIAENRNLWAALLNGGAQAIVREEFMFLVRNVSQERSMPDDRLPPELSLTIANSTVIEILAWWLRQEKDYSVDFVADLIVDLVFKPIAAVSTATNRKF